MATLPSESASVALCEAEPDKPARARHGRDLGIDALRGLAIFTMVGANMAPHMLQRPYPFWLRLYSSIAAPTFILLAGFMVGHLQVARPRPAMAYVKRMLGLIVVACFVDVVVWKVDPFPSFDVLYLIALVLPLSLVALRFPRLVTLLLVAGVLLGTPALQQAVGYDSESSHPVGDRLQALFIDGWFPVFPWLGVGVLGAVLGAYRQERSKESFARALAWSGVLLLAGGICLWWLTDPELGTPGGYAELFYPPTLGFLFAALGADFCLLALLSRPVTGWLWRGLAVYGRVSLLLYVVHLSVIAFLIKRWFEDESILTFLVVYLVHAIVLWWLALAVRRLWSAPRSFWGRLLLGG